MQACTQWPWSNLVYTLTNYPLHFPDWCRPVHSDLEVSSLFSLHEVRPWPQHKEEAGNGIQFKANAHASASSYHILNWWIWHYCTVRCRYNPVDFLQNPHKRHLIARPLGRGMGCLFLVLTLKYVVIRFNVRLYAISYHTGPRYNGTTLYGFFFWAYHLITKMFACLLYYINRVYLKYIVVCILLSEESITKIMHYPEWTPCCVLGVSKKILPFWKN